jgi:hypothetical protein
VAAKVPVTVTPFVFTAHNALRATVLGRDAWRRPATDSENGSIAALLDDALRAGSLGLSSNWFDTDRTRALVPSRLADDRELEALFAVLAKYPGAILQTIIRDAEQRERHRRLHRRPHPPLGDGTGGGRDPDGIEVTSRRWRRLRSPARLRSRHDGCYLRRDDNGPTRKLALVDAAWRHASTTTGTPAR